MRVLDQDLLAEFETCWREAGATYLDRWPEGLSDDEIDRLSGRLGFALPEEARRWYRWHDGSSGSFLTSHRVMTTLAEDVEYTRMLQEDNQFWRSGWLRVMDEKPLVAFDCRGDVDGPVPVWHYDFGFDPPTRPVFPSIGEMVVYWMSLVRTGAMVWVSGLGWRLAEPVADDVLAHLAGVPTD